MKNAISLSIALGLMLGTAAHAESYAQNVCASLRHERPTLRAGISVVCHFPVSASTGTILDRPSHFRCSPLTGGEKLPSVPAETSGSDCGNPFMGASR